MAAFQLAFTAQQSADGTEVVITDTSNWGSNDQSYTESQFVRQLVLTDALDNPIETLTLATGTDVATYDVPDKTNPWINITYIATGPVTLQKIQRYPFQRIFELAYLQAIKGNCGCGCIGDNAMCEVDAFYQGADFAVPIGDAVSYQDNIDSAYLLVSTV